MVHTRGWLLAALASAFLATILPGCVTDPGYEPPIECPKGLSDCNRQCVDVLVDRANCGACGTACVPEASCIDGDCICGGGLRACEDGCTDVATDANNCGDCGHVCEPDELCGGGRCVQRCPSDETECGRACVDVDSDARHCGDCDHACGDGRACGAGHCSCAVGTAACDGTCVDLENDPEHCGDCDFACAGGELCAGGRCVCPGGTTACDDGCVELFSDNDNCGACGHACTGSEVCSMGQCHDSCDRRTACGQSCVDLQTNEAHCGNCDHACTIDHLCIGGSCACPPGRAACGDACVDLERDAQHCGACGLACAPGQVCRAARCECPDDRVLCGTLCVDVDESAAHCGECNLRCEAGEVCSGGTCTTKCAPGEQLCKSSCVDVQTSRSHCGGCKRACDAGFVCDEGSCACPSGTSECSGTCVDTNASASHCGQCDKACEKGETCTGGGCTAGPQCADDACEHPSGISWGCRRRFMYGVNYGWEHFAGDFGGIPEWDVPGIAANEEAIDARMADMAAHGVDVVRWWVWPDFRGDGVQFESGTPAGLGPTVVADLEKALELANHHGLHLMLTLFSFDDFKPTNTTRGIEVHGLEPIATNAAKRSALVERVVRPFARAAEQSDNRDRLIAWDIINEPEWAMRGPSKYCRDDDFPAQNGLELVTHDEMEVFVSDVIRGLRAESRALITVGGAATFWRCAWKYVDTDFYQFHMYDWVDDWAPYDLGPAEQGIVDKPAIMGEFPMNGLGRARYTELLSTWYTSGWAGALGWAVTDGGFDWSAEKETVLDFSDAHSCQTHY